MFIVDARSSTPIYEQVIIGIKKLIIKGVLKKGDKLILDFRRFVEEANSLGIEEKDLLLLLTEEYKEIRGRV